MYRCETCQHEFEEPLYICDKEIIDYGIGSQWVTIFEGDVCPECENPHIETLEIEEV